MQSEDKRRRIVFHIGLERTGTTSIQNFCMYNRKSLLRNSILYPTRHNGFRGNNHIALAASYLSPHPLDMFLKPTGPRKVDVVASLKSEIDKTKAATVLISSEHFSSRFCRPQIQALANDFSDYECRIVIVLRDHIERFYSAYATHIGGGDVFGSVMLRDESLEYRYTDLIDLWRQAFGPNSVDVRLFDGHNNVLHWFFGPDGPLQMDRSFLSGRPTKWFDPFGGLTNRSLGPRRTEALRAGNAAVARVISSKTTIGARIRLMICAAAGGALQIADFRDPETARDRRPSKWGLSPEFQRRLLELAEGDRRQLKARFGLVLPRSEDQGGSNRTAWS